MKNNKNKGNSYERTISKILSYWLSEKKYDKALWRTSNSGARATIYSKNKMFNENNAGDIGKNIKDNIYPNIDLFMSKFVIECKKGYNTDFNFYPPFSKVFISIMKQCIKQSDSTEKEIFLIVKKNGGKDIVITPYNFKIQYQLNFLYNYVYYNVYYLNDLIDKNLKDIL